MKRLMTINTAEIHAVQFRVDRRENILKIQREAQKIKLEQ